MGLLSRFGKGLKATAPLFGQMAQYSMVQEADEKKYNRLLEAEERKWGRDLELHGMKTEASSAAAKSKAELDYFTNEKKNLIEGVKSLNSTLKPFISSDGTLIPLSEDQSALRDSLLKRISTYENAINKIDLMQRGAIGIDIDIMGIEDAIMYEAIDKAILEGDALEEINQAKESMFEGIGSPLDVTDQSSFGFGGKPLSIEKDIIEDQIKALEEVISEDPIYGRMNYELKDEHKDYYRSKLGSLSRKEPEGTEEKTDKGKAATTDKEIILPKENHRAMTEEDLSKLIRDNPTLYGHLSLKEALEPRGYKGLKWIWELITRNLKYSDWKEELLEMGIDPDATPEFDIPNLEKSNEGAFVTPSDDSIQKMIESFTEAQRIA